MLLERFDKFIRQNSLIVDNERVLACVSGGVDSMVMLDMLIKLYGDRVAVAHCNFGLRGEEADRETEMVINFCKERRIEIFVARFDTKAQLQKGESIQMAARRLRYDFFEQVANNEGFSRIAIAHNFDDKIETFFINLTRGAGLKGLQGMALSAGKIIRPILSFKRDEILRYAKQNSVLFLNDSSNNEDKYLRNKIRHSIVPIFREVSSFDVAMENTFENLSSQYEFLESCVKEKLQNFDIKSASKYLVYRYLEQFGFGSDVSQQVFNAAKEELNGKLFYSATHVATIDKGELVVQELDCQLDKLSFESTFEDFNELKSYASNDVCAYFDADCVNEELYLRLPQNGDAFIPFGMSGRKLLSDFFKDSGVNILERENRWLLCCGDDIIWVVGLRTDNRYRVRDTTKKVLKICLKK